MQRLKSSALLNRPLPQDDADELYRIYPDLPRNHMFGCPACGKNKGYGVDGELVLGDESFECNCHDQLQRHKHYLNAGIGSTYQFLSWQDYHGDVEAILAVQQWMAALDANVESGRGIYIWGESNGTGKTMLAALVLKECVMRGYVCYMTTFQNLLSSLKSGWKDADFDRWYRTKVDSAQVLLLDDIGKEITAGSGFNSDFSQQTFDSILRTRIQQARPTLFTSNMNVGQLAPHYGLAAVSLMGENTQVVHVRGSDYRPSALSMPKGKRRVY